MKCHFCGSTDIVFLTDQGDKFTVEKSNICRNCGLAFLQPRMSDEEVENYYLLDQYSSDFRDETSPSEEKRVRSQVVAKERWLTILEYVPDGKGKLLDIGCSSGEFLARAPAEFDVYGIDPSTGFARSQETDRANIRVGYFPEESFRDVVPEFDVITIYHTLEHAINPRDMLKHAYSRLKPDGLLFLEYPDLNKASLRIRLQPSYFQKSHLYDFSLFNLAPVLSKIGFSLEYFAFYRQYPFDKNVFIVCRKTTPETMYQIDPVQAKDLVHRLGIKLKQLYLIRDTPLRVVHIASHNINVGDGAISAGIRRMISEMCSTNIEFFNIDIVDYISANRALNAEDINSHRPDVVLVGGGGTIDGHEARNLTGTALMMPMSEIEKVNAKFGFIALGHNAFRNQDFHNKDILINFIEFCHANDFPFSVRMDRSFERLETLLERDLSGLVRRVPDPGFFVPPQDSRMSMYTPMDRKRIIIQMAIDNYGHRFSLDSLPENANELVVRFSSGLVSFIESVVKRFNTDIVIAMHTLDDLMSAALLVSKLEEQLRRIAVRVTPVIHPTYAPWFFKAYADADLAIGMRGHSVICPIGLGTPTIAISTHDKVEGFMSEIDCDRWSLNPLSEKFWWDLKCRTDELLDDPSRQQDIVARSTSEWHLILDDFLADCLKDIV